MYIISSFLDTFFLSSLSFPATRLLLWSLCSVISFSNLFLIFLCVSETSWLQQEMSELSGNWLKHRSVTETGGISWKKMGRNKESKGALYQAKSHLNTRSVRLIVTSAELGMPALTDNTIIMDAGYICCHLHISFCLCYQHSLLFPFISSLSPYSKCRISVFDLPNLGQVPSL